MSLKTERDTTIQKLFARHNLGSILDIPFSNEVSLSLINRIKSRLKDLEKDMEDKKVNFLARCILIHRNEHEKCYDHNIFTKIIGPRLLLVLI